MVSTEDLLYMIETYSKFERGFDFLCDLIEDKIKDHILIIPKEETKNFKFSFLKINDRAAGSIPLHDCIQEKINIPLEEEKKIYNIIKKLYDYLWKSSLHFLEARRELYEGYWSSQILRIVEGYVMNNFFFYLDCSITKNLIEQKQNDPFIISLKVCFLKPFGTGCKIENYKTFFLYAGNFKQKEIPPPPPQLSGISGLFIPPSISFSGINEDFPKPEKPALEYYSDSNLKIEKAILDKPSYLSDDGKHIIYRKTGEIDYSHRVDLHPSSDKDPGNYEESITKKFKWWENFIAKRFFNS